MRGQCIFVSTAHPTVFRCFAEAETSVIENARPMWSETAYRAGLCPEKYIHTHRWLGGYFVSFFFFSFQKAQCRKRKLSTCLPITIPVEDQSNTLSTFATSFPYQDAWTEGGNPVGTETKWAEAGIQIALINRKKPQSSSQHLMLSSPISGAITPDGTYGVTF